MPYWIAAPGQTADCAGWATVKEEMGDLVVVACHELKQDAIDQAIAISLSEGDQSLFKGEWGKRAMDGEPIVICDIDDTLIHAGQLVQKVYAFVDEVPGGLFLITGRPESQRADTEKELTDLGVEYTRLIMNDGSTANSNIFKKQAAEKLLETYNIVLAVENNPDARAAYKSLGIDVMNPSDIPDQPADATESNSSRVTLQLRDAGDWELLNERQQEQAENTAELALEFGMFNQTSGADGAHYAPAANNPFKADGLMCRNCVFFDELNNQCQVVAGPIEPEAVCKLWVIPESDIMTEQNRFVDIANNLVMKLTGETRSKQREIRTQDINFEMRAIDETGMRFSGYAAVFNSASRDLGGFVEYIQPGAFARSLASRNKIMLLWNHDTSAPLASTRNGSLTLREDERGLFVEATLPDTTLGRDIAAQVRSGLTDSMSFGFQVKKDSWNPAGNERTLEDVSLFEVSLVTSEAYSATAGTVSVRNYVATAEKVDIDANVLADAMNDFEQGNELSAEKAGVIQAVLEKLTTPSVEETPSADLLAIKRKQFELLLKELDLG